jgi:predicted methyltransferase
MEPVKKTQLEQVRHHLKRYGSITTWKAIQRYRITRLSKYIGDLIHKEKLNIYKDRRKDKVTKKSFVVYELREW